MEGHDKPCYYCGEPCNGLAGNPSRWPIPLCHRDEPGWVKWHHIGCVTSRLIENRVEGIVAAAIRANGLTISMPSPSRHHHILKAMPARMAKAVLPSDQGFVTDAGRFVGRHEALEIASRNGQLLKPTSHRELFSEDLW